MTGNKKAKIIFMGTPFFAEAILAALIGAGHEIAGVFTQPDKKAGRGRDLRKSAVKILAEKHNIPVFEPEKLDLETVEKIKELDPDLIVAAAYGKIIPESILEIPKFKALNVHPSLLPKFRGASPIQNSILAGEAETGTTIMLMDKGMDTGDILSQEKVHVGGDETYPELSEKLAAISGKLLLQTIPGWIAGKIIPQKQNDAAASYCRMMKREDGKIAWTESAEEIYNKFRAFCPWPGVFAVWARNGKQLRIKFNKISFTGKNQEETRQPGEIFRIGEKIGAQTNFGSIILEEIQLEGKSPVPIRVFLNGYPDFVGTILK